VKRRRWTRRAARREAINRDIINLFRLKLAIQYLDEGQSLQMVATLFGMSCSLLCHLRQRYERSGFAAVAPTLAAICPRALGMDVFDPEFLKRGPSAPDDGAPGH
jgi:hypothetical protein